MNKHIKRIGELLRTQNNLYTSEPLYTVQQRKEIWLEDSDHHVDHWEFVTVCFTRKSADEYIEDNSHRLNTPRVYVESAERNPEMIAVRKLLLKLSEVFE